MLSRLHKNKQDVKLCVCIHVHSTTTNMKKCLHSFVMHWKNMKEAMKMLAVVISGWWVEDDVNFSYSVLLFSRFSINSLRPGSKLFETPSHARSFCVGSSLKICPFTNGVNFLQNPTRCVQVLHIQGSSHF